MLWYVFDRTGRVLFRFSIFSATFIEKGIPVYVEPGGGQRFPPDLEKVGLTHNLSKLLQFVNIAL